MKKIAIAIDGPAGAGKSSVAKALAKKLNYLYVDTGAMYRAVAWALLEYNIPLKNNEELTSFLKGLNLKMELDPSGFLISVKGKDVTEFIRSKEINAIVSTVATIPEVRDYLVSLQREMADSGGIILDGRDIGSVVLPKAEMKFFLTASVSSRVERRWKEVEDIQKITKEEIRKNVIDRDYMDENREISPLVCVPDAVVVDSSEMTFDETVAHMLQLIEEKIHDK